MHLELLTLDLVEAQHRDQNLSLLQRYSRAGLQLFLKHREHDNESVSNTNLSGLHGEDTAPAQNVSTTMYVQGTLWTPHVDVLNEHRESTSRPVLVIVPSH